MLTVCTWLWGNKYSADDVAKLRAGLKCHLKQPHNLYCVTDDPRRLSALYSEVDAVKMWDADLTRRKGCFARLRMFDPEWQDFFKIDDRLVCMDLDTVITGPLDPLFDRPEPFVILQGANALNPCPFNGSLMMLRAGAHPEVWGDFTLDKAKAVPFYEFPDDQGWLWHKIPNAAGWRAGSASGVYAFQKPGWPSGTSLPADARMVVFPGWRSPQQFRHLPWVEKNWAA